MGRACPSIAWEDRSQDEMTSVTVLESVLDVGREVVELLGIKPGESFKITTTRDGRLILARKPQP
jgi:hypothetical protein